MEKLTVVFITVICVLVPDLAFAYVGPGAGLSLLGALWALVAAVGMALIFVIAWPIRRMRRRKREAEAAKKRDPVAAPSLDRDAGQSNRGPSRQQGTSDPKDDLDRLPTP